MTQFEAQPLNPGTSAQLAELIVLIRALELAEGQTVNIYTNSKWVYTLLHAHTQLYREKGMIDSKGNPIKYKKQVEESLQAILKPKAVAVIHCRGHQKGHTEIVKGNNFADQAAKNTAKTDSCVEKEPTPRC